MRTTFSRLSSVTALIILVAVVGLGMSFRVMVKTTWQMSRRKLCKPGQLPHQSSPPIM